MKNAKIIKLPNANEKNLITHDIIKDQLINEIIVELNMMNEILSSALNQKDKKCQ